MIVIKFNIQIQIDLKSINPGSVMEKSEINKSDIIK